MTDLEITEALNLLAKMQKLGIQMTDLGRRDLCDQATVLTREMRTALRDREAARR